MRRQKNYSVKNMLTELLEKSDLTYIKRWGVWMSHQLWSDEAGDMRNPPIRHLCLSQEGTLSVQTYNLLGQTILASASSYKEVKIFDGVPENIASEIRAGFSE